MSTSSNTQIQQLISEVETLDTGDNALEAKLQLIAQRIAEEQRRIKAAMSSDTDDAALVDPAEVFACEGCQ